MKSEDFHFFIAEREYLRRSQRYSRLDVQDKNSVFCFAHPSLIRTFADKLRKMKDCDTRKSSVLLIYTGGTIGMVRNAETGALENFDFGHLLEQVPELKRFDCKISTYTFQPPIDTMAYTASALSFMLENLGKPVILTGSQLPIDMLRTDGKENLISAIEIAATRRSDGSPMVPEVCIYFKEKLLRGNRTTKISAEQFNAFRSFNYPELAKAGIHIRYNEAAIRRPDPSRPMKAHYLVDPNVVVLSLFPGIQQRLVHAVLNIPGLKAVVLRTFGAGNAPQAPWFRDELQDATSRGILLVNITQCQDGAVHMGLYETSLPLIDAGVVCGYDSTPECAIAKLMFLLGHQLPPEELRRMMDSDLAGEITKS